MPYTRLVLAALLVCSALAFAQKQSDSLSGVVQAGDAGKFGKAAPIEKEQIALNRPDLSTQNALQRMHGLPFKADTRSDLIALNLDGQPGGDTTCYAIRSYVVARDSKDSEATHPVSYSTCQPARRYGLKKAQLRGESANH
jgi:hypothetical protein